MARALLTALSLASMVSRHGLAADKSGVSPSAISLPRGPGSIEGLGESFQPHLNTGTAKYAVGLKLPPGVAGHQPGLSLNYDAGGANGTLGYGWSLPLPCVQRQTDKGIPTYDEDIGFPRTDVFINEAKEELVPQADGFFFCKNEGSFIRYRPRGDHWEATRPDGTRLEFGLTSDGRVAEGSRVFAWLLERETDTHGNVIEYRHRSFPGHENLNQKYPTLVRYGPGAPPWTHFHFVAFHYEDRPDWFEDGRAGFLVRTGKRLTSVVVGSQGPVLTDHQQGDFDGDGTVDLLNRRYELSYLPYAGPNSHWSLLEKVRLVGSDGSTALPPVTFHYAVCHPPAELSAQGHILGGTNEPAAVMDNPFVELADLNADGLPDLLRTELGGAHVATLNRSTDPATEGTAVRWSDPVTVDPGSGTSWNFDLASDRTHLADMDGDGLADLVHKSADDAVFFFANRGRVGWSERRDMAAQESAPPAPFGQPDVRMADMDFDKDTDIVQSIDVGGSTALRIWFNLGAQTYAAPVTIEASEFPGFSVPGVQIADCNGDRVPDLVRVQPQGVVARAGLGYGHFAPPQTLALPDATLSQEQIDQARLTDINGDGLADLVLERAAPGTCWYWLNLGNYTLSERHGIVDLPVAISSTAAVRWADLDGNGTTDLIYADSQSNPRVQAVDLGGLLTPGGVPNALTRIENGIGRVIRVEYAPSTRFALEDAAAGRPWPDPLPFPVQVVAQVTVSDSLGHEYRTRFLYHDGYYDPFERQFRGFARVEQVEEGDATAPTLVTRSHFDTGRTFESMKGKLRRLTASLTDGKVFWDEVTTWAEPPRALMTGTNGETVRFAHPTGTVKELVELGNGEPRRLETESEFDHFGNLIRSAQYGIVEGTNRAAFRDERVVTTAFALNTNAWILHLPRREEVADLKGTVISRIDSFYDDETFSGTNPGTVTVGNLTLQRSWIDPANPEAFVRSIRTRFDAFGNPIASWDPLADDGGQANVGHLRELAYDDEFHTHPIRETIHIGGGKRALTMQARYDQGFGVVVSAIDFNDHLTGYGYDPFGRLSQVMRPGDPTGYPSVEYHYAMAVPTGTTGLVNYVETRLRDRSVVLGPRSEMYLLSRQYSDGLGRALMTRGEAEPAPGGTAPRVVVSGAVNFNARQRPAQTLNDFFTTRAGSLEELLAFENIEAPGWRGDFHENGSLVRHDLTAAPVSATEYDATLRAIRTTHPDGTSARTVHEPLVAQVFDENDTDPASPHVDTPMVHHSDGLGRLIRVDEQVRLADDGTPSASTHTWSTRYEYDPNSRLTRITDSQDNVKELRYDGLGRKTFMNDPDAGISTQTYDDASNLIESVDAKGQRILRTYDGANRLLTEDFADHDSPEFSYRRSPDVSYVYDQPASEVDLGNGRNATASNTRGQLAYVDDASGQEHNSYDARGRLQWTVKRLADPQLDPADTEAPTSLVAFTTAFEYDDMDRVTRLTYPDNDEVGYEYNERGLLRRIQGGPNGSLLTTLGYTPSAQEAELEFGNGVRTTHAYDVRQRLTHVRSVLQPPRAPSVLMDFSYSFDPASNLQSITDQRPTSTVPTADRRRNSQHFLYDNLDRLTRVEYNPPNQASDNGGNIHYRYDRIGNLLAQTSDMVQFENGDSVTDLGRIDYGGSAGSTHRMGRAPNAPPGPHAASGVVRPGTTDRTLSYDANGNLTMMGGLRCTWDFKDRLVAVEDESMRAEYQYDFADRRVRKLVWSKPPDGSLSPLPTPRPTAVLYPGKHFEVREHDQPIKYVFSGERRVARVTGSLSTNERVQRLRLSPGWNLCSMAVSGIRPFRESITAAYRWNESGRNWVPVTTDERLEAGDVVWLRSPGHTHLALTGPYTEPTPQPISPGGSFVSGPGLEGQSLAPLGPDFTWSSFDPFRQLWQTSNSSIPLRDDALPETLAPGQAVFVSTSAPAELEIPDPALRVWYYHEDHLGSAALLSDADGRLIEETTFYPFGVERNSHRPRGVENPYRFTGKERDRESGLHYVEARFLAAPIARFVSVDPKYANPDGLSSAALASFLSRPQALNLYGYGFNNPLRYADPSGLDAVSKVATTSDAVGIVAGAADEISIFGSLKGLNTPGAVSTGANVAGKATAGISVGIKAYEFAKDPSSATGAQLANETAKGLTGLACPPVGLIWSVLDLTGYGPSAILEATEQSTRALRASAEAYTQAAESSRQMVRIVNEYAPRIEGKQLQARDRLKVLNQKVARLNQTTQKVLKGDTRSLAELNAAIQRQEQINKRMEAQLARELARLRELQK